MLVGLFVGLFVWFGLVCLVCLFFGGGGVALIGGGVGGFDAVTVVGSF